VQVELLVLSNFLNQVDVIQLKHSLPSTEGAIKKDNPEKLATRRRKTKQNNNTTRYMLDTTIHKQTQIT
jgi:hypothetical protein